MLDILDRDELLCSFRPHTAQHVKHMRVLLCFFVTDAGSLGHSSTWETEWIPLDKSERKKPKGVFQNVNKWKPFFFLPLLHFSLALKLPFLRLLSPSLLLISSPLRIQDRHTSHPFWRETERSFCAGQNQFFATLPFHGIFMVESGREFAGRFLRALESMLRRGHCWVEIMVHRGL